MLDLQLPRRLANTVARRVAPIVIAWVIALGVALLPLVAYAGIITVDGTTCTLPDAITAANTDTATGGCTAGSGDDTLLLGGLTHSLATGPYDHDGMTATPSVTTKVVISGGVGGAVVGRSGAAQYRLFHVGATGNLTLQNIIVRNGDVNFYNFYPNNAGGAIYNLGVLTLLDSQVIFNKAHYGGGIHNDGTTTLTNSIFFSNMAYMGGAGVHNRETVTVSNSDFISNTSRYGGALDNLGTATLTKSDFISNSRGISNNGTATLTNCDFTANMHGGVFNRGEITLDTGEFFANIGGGMVNTGGTANLTNIDFISNTALFRGGGLNNEGLDDMPFTDGTVTISNTHFISNTSGNEGGGFHNSSIATLMDSDFISNTAQHGGGLYNGGSATVMNSNFVSNMATGQGGGFYNYGRKAILINSDFISNTATNGGGLNNVVTPITVTNSNFTFNTATARGGGIYNYGSSITLTDSDFFSNTAAYGGALFSRDYRSSITVTNIEIRANIAFTSGGGWYQEDGHTKIVNSRFLDNLADVTGSAVQQITGTITIDQSCIVNNSDTAINYEDGDPIDAANNWWGAADGPGGVGPGTGDSVSSNVSFVPFPVENPADCVFVKNMANLAVSMLANTSQATVGDTITYTYRITNTGNVALTTISAGDDKLGAIEGLAGELAPNATRSTTLTYVVQESDLPGPLTNSVTVTGTDSFDTEVTASASVSVSLLPIEAQSPENFLPYVVR